MNALLIAAPLALLVGLSLGLLGGGGSILTVPILVYVLGLAPKSAIATSLIVVGLTSLVGLARHAKSGNVSGRLGLAFGLAGVAGASAGSRLAAQPWMPERVLLGLFALLMVVVAAMMLRGRPSGTSHPGQRHPAKIALYGLLTGALTGVLGVGGGFVIVPVLTLIAGLPIRIAIGTSLLVIAINCLAALIGFLGQVPIRWELALVFAALSAVGSLIGAHMTDRVPPAALRRGFAMFIILMGIIMLGEQAIHLL